MKNNKGITLIALIVTIVVLLILAGISIAAITGNENMPGKAAEARDKHAISITKEEVKTAVLNSATLEGNFVLQDVINAINQNVNDATVLNNEFPLKVSINNQENVTILEDGTTIDGEIVEYIKSTGTQYIDTGVIPSDKIDFEITFKTDVSAMSVELETGQAFLGTNNNDINKTYSFNFGGKQNEKYIYLWKNNTYKNGASVNRFLTTTNNPKNIITISCINDVWIVNGNTKNASASVGTWKDENNTIVVFGFSKINNGEKTITPFYENMYLYSLKIWERDGNGNSTLIREFIPVKSAENGHEGEACLYDLVGGTFYYNQGTGSFETN